VPLPAPTSACDAFLPGPYAVAASTQISSGVEVYSTYDLTFTMALSSTFASSSAWRNVLHFGDANTMRLPSIWFRDDDPFKLYLRSGTPSSYEWGVDYVGPTGSTSDFVPGNTYTIKIRVDNTHMTAYVDNVWVGQEARTNWDSLAYTDMPVYTSIWPATNTAEGVTLSDICLKDLGLTAPTQSPIPRPTPRPTPRPVAPPPAPRPGSNSGSGGGASSSESGSG
jgi:hypothetical protein